MRDHDAMQESFVRVQIRCRDASFLKHRWKISTSDDVGVAETETAATERRSRLIPAKNVTPDVDVQPFPLPDRHGMSRHVCVRLTSFAEKICH